MQLEKQDDSLARAALCPTDSTWAGGHVIQQFLHAVAVGAGAVRIGTSVRVREKLHVKIDGELPLLPLAVDLRAARLGVGPIFPTDLLVRFPSHRHGPKFVGMPNSLVTVAAQLKALATPAQEAAPCQNLPVTSAACAQEFWSPGCRQEIKDHHARVLGPSKLIELIMVPLTQVQESLACVEYFAE
eukprot:CAMPEP_0171462132 /NCGR_PEP_ID=MMETSP0945-20130129/6296_1 /TAXON_ID=109269 /ORGANISM="Vaucheria litorea, Strain CCMP2940" /LENGTH=185 /DNA_ID=CAMNT_0011988605 /DNA_START=345 /DNA_END=902 /DNA_ORIENTATION=+